MHLHSFMVIKYFCMVYRTISKYCRIISRRILNKTMSSMIASDPQSRMFQCYTSTWHSCYKSDIISLDTSDELRSPICIFIQVSFLFTPQNWACSPWCLTELDLTLPVVNFGGNSVQIHPNTCNHIFLVPRLAHAVTWSRGPRPWCGFTHGPPNTATCPI